MYRKRAVFAGGGVVAVILVGSTMLAWSNGAFGTPAVDRVGSFRTIEAQLAQKTSATSTTTSRPSSRSVPRTSRPRVLVGPTRPTTQEPIIEPNRAQDGATISLEPATRTTVAGVTASSRARPRPDDDVEPSDGRGNDD
jgi:hypothetical protein